MEPLQVPPSELDLTVTRYVSMIGLLNDTTRPKLEKSLEDLDAFKNFCFLKCDEKRTKMYKYKIEKNNIGLLPIQIFLHNELHKLQDLHDQAHKKIYSMYLVKTTLVIDYLREQSSKGFAAEGFSKVLSADLSIELQNSPDIEATRKKLIALDLYAQKFMDKKKYPKITKKILEDSLAKNSKFIIKQFSYCQYTDFDDRLDVFLRINEDVNRVVEEYVEEVAKKPFDLCNFVSFYKKMCEFVEVEGKEEAIVFKSAIMREVFDRLYVRCFQFDPASDDEIISRCSFAQWATPRGMKISPSLVGERHMDTPFSVLARNELHSVSDALISIQFCTSPNDMVYYCAKALQEIDNFVMSSKRQQKYGQFESMFDNKISTDLSFDDCFSILWPIFNISRPCGALQLSEFFKRIVGIKFSSTMEFSKMMIISVIDYSKGIDIKEITKELEDKQDILDIDDPLRS